jgi:hypothetical protein
VNLGDRILSSLKTIVLIEERTKALDDAFKGLKTKIDNSVADHEKRLTRLETIIEITRPDGGVLRIAPSSDKYPKGNVGTADIEGTGRAID